MEQELHSFSSFLDYKGVSDALSKAHEFINSKDYSRPLVIHSRLGNGKTHFLRAMVMALGCNVRNIVDVASLNQMSGLYSWLGLNPCVDEYLCAPGYGCFVDGLELIESDFQDRLVSMVDFKWKMGHPVIVTVDSGLYDFTLSRLGLYNAKCCELGLPSVDDAARILTHLAQWEEGVLPAEVALRLFMSLELPSMQNLIDVLRPLYSYCKFFGVAPSVNVYGFYKAGLPPVIID